MIRFQKIEKPGFRIGFFDYAIADIRPVEARHEHACLVEAKPGDYLRAGLLIGSRRQRDARHVGKAFVQHRKLDIFRTEIVAPLRHAMRFVDGKQRESAGTLHFFE